MAYKRYKRLTEKQKLKLISKQLQRRMGVSTKEFNQIMKQVQKMGEKANESL